MQLASPCKGISDEYTWISTKHIQIEQQKISKIN